MSAPPYQELHALIVRQAQEHCRSEPLCQGCPLGGALCPWPRPAAVPP
jgi:endonuclease III-like uncharacterized protein